jgi:hypothetical protein
MKIPAKTGKDKTMSCGQKECLSFSCYELRVIETKTAIQEMALMAITQGVNQWGVGDYAEKENIKI